jgi:hypothetical protein
MREYHPPDGMKSTTLIPGSTPKKVSVSTGWRYWSRTPSCPRTGLATASVSAGFT